jgi:hypothetical protein
LAKVTNCVITGNFATSIGGGIYLTGGRSASAVGCSLLANQAGTKGGGGFVDAGADFSSGTVVSNNAPEGGGLRLENRGQVRNTQINGNSASVGGGLYLLSGSAQNCTIAANSAGYAGGLYFDQGGVTNTIIYFNDAPTGPNRANASANGVYAYSCTTPAVGGIGNLMADPRFLNWPAGDFRLATNSPCLNTGIPLPWMTNATDLAGNPRVHGPSADMGAYESFLPGLDTDGDGLPDWWEWAWARSLTALAPQADDDGDGASNANEFVAGTNPTDPQDSLKIHGLDFDPRSGQVVIAWNTVPGRIYTVLAAPEVTGPWTNGVAKFTASTAHRQSFTNTTGLGTKSFLRLGARVQP